MNNHQTKSKLDSVILGVNALGHDSSACLIVNGEIKGAIEEERFNREKHTSKFPFSSIEYLLKVNNLFPEDIDEIAFCWSDKKLFWKSVWKLLIENIGTPINMVGLIFRRLTGVSNLMKLEKELKKVFPKLPKITYVPHHIAHCRWACHTSPFKPDLVFIVDGRGEYVSTSIYNFEKGTENPQILEELIYPNSLGVYFGAVTQALGFKANEDEGKVMGLAPYGVNNEKYSPFFSNFLMIESKGSFKLDKAALNILHCDDSNYNWLKLNQFDDELATKPVSLNFNLKSDFAKMAQDKLELAMGALVEKHLKKPDGENIVISGGVALNGRMVSSIKSLNAVNNIFAPFAPNDSGCCLGAALFALSTHPQKRDDSITSPFLGPSFLQENIEAVLKQNSLSFMKCDCIGKETARLLSRGEVIAWFQGRMEFGPRALGARSILADPRVENTRNKVNNLVKFREDFRPFAPSILEEFSTQYFDLTKNYYMSEVVDAKDICKLKAPAVVHVDGTSRPQTVPKHWYVPEFRTLIEEFHNITGIPLVLNTSFNLAGEPIVCTPEHAIKSFNKMGLEWMAIGDFLVSKNGFPK